MSVKKIGFAFGGPVAAGKSFTAKSISSLLDCNIYSFTTRLNQFTSILGTKYPELNTDLSNCKLRQTVNHGLKSVLGTDIWIKSTLNDIKADETIEQDLSFVIIDDLKYVSEYDALKKDRFCDWYFIYLSVPQLTRISRLKKLYPDNWKDHFNESNLGKEVISLNKYDCIALSIDNVLKFIYKIVSEII